MIDPKKPGATSGGRVNVKTLDFYLTPTHACNYLPGREAASLVADVGARITTQTYGALIDYGFRRSGEYIYRPHCQGCTACIPVRVPVAAFRPRRSQRRTWQRNQDLKVRRVPVVYQEEHFQLYQRYIADRHRGGGMDHTDSEHYLEFMHAAGIDTGLYEFRSAERLLAVAVVDHLAQGFSAVYTFFDPAEHARSLGVYAVLWQIEELKRRGLPWLYLGYWIKECRKMNYKGRYRPLEIYRDGQWIRNDE